MLAGGHGQKLKGRLRNPGPAAPSFVVRLAGPLAAALAFLIGAARAAAGVQLKTAVQLESIHVKIDFYRFGTVEKIFIDNKLETVHIKLLIRVIGLVQSHGQAGAASATFIKENPDGTDFLALEISRDLLTGRRCNFEHDVLLTSSTIFHQSPADC
jgi:hypothetical protein